MVWRRVEEREGSIILDACITHVGDSLLLLPQQLEPYFTRENTYLMLALKTGKIPYQSDNDDEKSERGVLCIGIRRCCVVDDNIFSNIKQE